MRRVECHSRVGEVQPDLPQRRRRVVYIEKTQQRVAIGINGDQQSIVVYEQCIVRREARERTARFAEMNAAPVSVFFALDDGNGAAVGREQQFGGIHVEVEFGRRLGGQSQHLSGWYVSQERITQQRK